MKEESKKVDTNIDKKKNDNIDFQDAFQIEFQDESSLWHFIFGHLNFGGMNLLHRKNMVKGFPLIEEQKWFVKATFFASSIERLFQSESHIGHTHHLKLCTLIFLVQCRHHPLVDAIIF